MGETGKHTNAHARRSVLYHRLEERFFVVALSRKSRVMSEKAARGACFHVAYAPDDGSFALASAPHMAAPCAVYGSLANAP